MINTPEQILSIYLQEYSQLKHEQVQRIGFRDNLLYVTLGLYGGILSLILGEKSNPYALLMLPWISLILGWTYLVNDQKITAIGYYIRHTWVEQVSTILSAPSSSSLTTSLLGWEIAHRVDQARMRRKVEQLMVDEIAFVVSGIAALMTFEYLVDPLNWAVQFLWFTELAVLVILGVEIAMQADLRRE